ncbi:unnamed protein product [Owenia fusiformis]|nr:unnamed protein product [Owenia fusiformis]
MAGDCNKTVLVLDRSPIFASSSKQTVEFDIFTKAKAGMIPLAPIVKSLWTCSVEAAIEFCRIIYDLFPTEKLVRMVVSDRSAAVLNNWTPGQQNINLLLNCLGAIPPPSIEDPADDCTVIHGLASAVQALCDASADQEGEPNNGTIVCLTSAKSEAQIRILETYVQDAITRHNKTNDSLLPIDHCHLVIIHTVPVGDVSPIQERTVREVSPVLSSEVLVSQSGRYMAVKLIQLAVKFFDLCLTTVTGIPMKEEQNASSSANYDVELLHRKAAHQDFFKSGHADGVLIPSKEDLCLESVSLKWCNPKSNFVELHQCTGAYRITPVDVNSRPSMCLTNFLLSGRAVMLEQPRKSGTKLISHMLTSHGGEIYIHTMATNRSILEETPSISEGLGGRITDYRITDFGELMKDCRLAPRLSQLNEGEPLPIDRAKGQIERLTRVWPIVISDTIIFNMLSHLDPLPSLISKETLDEDDVLECKKAIYHVVGMESRHEPLPVPASGGTRGKGTKR